MGTLLVGDLNTMTGQAAEAARRRRASFGCLLLCSMGALAFTLSPARSAAQGAPPSNVAGEPGGISPEAQVPGQPPEVRTVIFRQRPGGDCERGAWEGTEWRCVEEVDRWFTPDKAGEAEAQAEVLAQARAFSLGYFFLQQDLAARWMGHSEDQRFALSTAMGEGVRRPPTPSSSWRATPISVRGKRYTVSLPPPARDVAPYLCPSLLYSPQEGLSLGEICPEGEALEADGSGCGPEKGPGEGTALWHGGPAYSLCRDGFARDFTETGTYTPLTGHIFSTALGDLSGPFIEGIYPSLLSEEPPWPAGSLDRPMREGESGGAGTAGLVLAEAYDELIARLGKVIFRYGVGTYSQVHLRSLAALSLMHLSDNDLQAEAEPSSNPQATGRTDPIEVRGAEVAEEAGEITADWMVDARRLPPSVVQTWLQRLLTQRGWYGVASVAEIDGELVALKADWAEHHGRVYAWLRGGQEPLYLPWGPVRELTMGLAQALHCHQVFRGPESAARRDLCLAAEVRVLPQEASDNRRLEVVSQNVSEGGASGEEGLRLMMVDQRGGLAPLASPILPPEVVLPPSLELSEWRSLLRVMDPSGSDRLREHLYGRLIAAFMGSVMALELERTTGAPELSRAEVPLEDHALKEALRASISTWEAVVTRGAALPEHRLLNSPEGMLTGDGDLSAEELPADLLDPEAGQVIFRRLAEAYIGWREGYEGTSEPCESLEGGSWQTGDLGEGPGRRRQKPCAWIPEVEETDAWMEGLRALRQVEERLRMEREHLREALIDAARGGLASPSPTGGTSQVSADEAVARRSLRAEALEMMYGSAAGALGASEGESPNATSPLVLLDPSPLKEPERYLRVDEVSYRLERVWRARQQVEGEKEALWDLLRSDARLRASRDVRPRALPPRLHPFQTMSLGLQLPAEEDGEERSVGRWTPQHVELYQRWIAPALARSALELLRPLFKSQAQGQRAELEEQVQDRLLALLPRVWLESEGGQGSEILTLGLHRQLMSRVLAALMGPVEVGEVDPQGGWESWSAIRRRMILEDRIRKEKTQDVSRQLDSDLLTAAVLGMGTAGAEPEMGALFMEGALASLGEGARSLGRSITPRQLEETADERWRGYLRAQRRGIRQMRVPGRERAHPLAVCSPGSASGEEALDSPSIKMITVEVIFRGPSFNRSGAEDDQPLTGENLLWLAREHLPFVAMDGHFRHLFPEGGAFGHLYQRREAGGEGAAAEEDPLPLRLGEPEVVPLFELSGPPDVPRSAIYRARWRVWSGWHLLWNLQARTDEEGPAVEAPTWTPILSTAALCDDTQLIARDLEPTLLRWALLNESTPTRPYTGPRDVEPGQDAEEGGVNVTEAREGAAAAGDDMKGRLSAKGSGDALAGAGFAQLLPPQRRLREELRQHLYAALRRDPRPLKSGGAESPVLLVVADLEPGALPRLQDVRRLWPIRRTPYLRASPPSPHLGGRDERWTASVWGIGIAADTGGGRYYHVAPDYQPPRNPNGALWDLRWWSRVLTDAGADLALGPALRATESVFVGDELLFEQTTGQPPGGGAHTMTRPLQASAGVYADWWTSELVRSAVEVGLNLRTEILPPGFEICALDLAGQVDVLLEGGDPECQFATDQSWLFKISSGPTFGLRFQGLPSLGGRTSLGSRPWGTAGLDGGRIRLKRWEWGARVTPIALGVDNGKRALSSGLLMWAGPSLSRGFGATQTMSPYDPLFNVGVYARFDRAWSQPQRDESPSLTTAGWTISAGLHGHIDWRNRAIGFE